MRDFTGNNANQAGRGNRVCRVAYTINNTQPVISTIIGEEPLFYMDYACEDYDDEYFDAEEFNLLKESIAALQGKEQSFERFSNGFADDADQSFDLFLENQHSIVGDVRADIPAIDALIVQLQESRLAAAYLDFAKEHNVQLCYSAQIKDAFYDRRDGSIFINPHLELVDQTLLAARELRRHWQHRNGAFIHPLLFQPDNAILINRMQRVDGIIAMVRIAWELQLSDYKAAWERIENSSLRDLGHAFAKEAFRDFRTINNGEAAAAALESWFLSERCRVADRQLIQQMLVDYNGPAFGEEESQSSITPALIAALGTMPFGKNYLSAHVYTLMSDPIFTDVRDRSNANFLWFIKFERSFQEAEHDLQTSSVSDAGDVRHTAFQTEQDDGNAQQENATGQVIEFLPAGDISKGHTKELLKPRSTQGSVQETNNVVYLRRWSGE